jgi:diguanylate cyclase (GGDEF)-like protein
MLRAEAAEILLQQDLEPDGSVRRWLATEGSVINERYAPKSYDWPVARVMTDDEALVVSRSVRDRGLRGFLQGRDIRDCILAPLRVDNRVIGTLMVANRHSDVSTFTADDGRLLATVAAQVSRALENGWLLDRLTHDSLHDALTGLANRNYYQSRLREALQAPGVQPPMAVMIMDLDRFKEINDTLGHHHGDLLIREVAARLAESAPPGTTVARLGGDEFALLLPKTDMEQAAEVARQLREAVSAPCHLDGVTIDVQASIGIAVAPMHGDDHSVLLKRADVAMYAAKSAGTGVESYDSERDSYSPRRLALASQLRRAIEADELLLHYQPVVNTVDGQFRSVEALVRWQHAEYGTVSPAEFVPIAEQSGAIIELTRWVVQEATRQLAQWRSSGVPIGVSINLSMRNLLDTGIAELVEESLRQRGLPGSALTLEITESHIMADPARTLPVLHKLADLGARLSIDDFGTGYSSLAHLKQMPVHELKVDRSFITQLRDDEADEAIVRAIITLAQSLSLDVVAEGVEDLETLRRLAALGCPHAQGYAISPPLPPEEIPARLRTRPIMPRQAVNSPAERHPQLAI